jgi:hypothetical protein
MCGRRVIDYLCGGFADWASAYFFDTCQRLHVLVAVVARSLRVEAVSGKRLGSYAYTGLARVFPHALPPSHFFPSSLSLGAGSSVVFFSLSHQSFQNFSSSTRFFSFANLSSRLESIVANHSSRAASSSARVAYWFMQLFIAFCCVRHEKVAVKVLFEQQAAKSKEKHLSIGYALIVQWSSETYL